MSSRTIAFDLLMSAQQNLEQALRLIAVDADKSIMQHARARLQEGFMWVDVAIRSDQGREDRATLVVMRRLAD